MALTPKNELTREEKRAKKADAEQEALLREVDDAVRQSDADAFLARWGKPLFALLILGLAAFAGYLYWDSRQEAAMERDSEALVGALDQIQAGNLDSGYAQLEELAGKEGGAAIAAIMMRAGIAEQRGDTEEAATLFGQVAENVLGPRGRTLFHLIIFFGVALAMGVFVFVISRLFAVELAPGHPGHPGDRVLCPL